MAKVKIEGNTLDLPDDIAKSNKSLTDALTPFYPAAANATITREEKKGQEMIVTVTKKAGTKGAERQGAVITALDAAPEELSAILAIEARGKRVTHVALDEALMKAMDEEREIERVITAIANGETLPAQMVPVGF